MPLLLPYLLLSQLPPPQANDATVRSARRTSENAVNAKFAEISFHELASITLSPMLKEERL
jgi:hypothetical protein